MCILFSNQLLIGYLLLMLVTPSGNQSYLCVYHIISEDHFRSVNLSIVWQLLQSVPNRLGVLAGATGGGFGSPHNDNTGIRWQSLVIPDYMFKAPEPAPLPVITGNTVCVRVSFVSVFVSGCLRARWSSLRFYV